MIDRGIALASLALSIILWALPLIIPKVPAWISKMGALLGVFMLGYSLSFFSGPMKSSTSGHQLLDKAFLSLQIYEDNRMPVRLSAENIFRWYYLKTISIYLDPKGKLQSDSTIGVLFVSFEADVKTSSLQVKSPDIKLPPFEVKEFNQRYAIIVFGNIIPAGTLEISVAP